jgi:heme/copper-type cytochrome/quinol oxidase subunit 2
MNKKAQREMDWSNPLNWPYLILYVAVVIIVISLLTQALWQFNCEGVIKERDNYRSQLETCNQKLLSMNETIANCTSLIQEQKEICNNRIENATQECETDKQNCKDNFDAGKVVFVIYTFSLSLGICLSFNLFKIIFKVGLSKEWEEKVEKIERIWLITKICLWIVFVLVSLIAFVSFLLTNPLMHP